MHKMHQIKQILANIYECALLNEIPTEETKGMLKSAPCNEGPDKDKICPTNINFYISTYFLWNDW